MNNRRKDPLTVSTIYLTNPAKLLDFPQSTHSIQRGRKENNVTSQSRTTWSLPKQKNSRTHSSSTARSDIFFIVRFKFPSFPSPFLLPNNTLSFSQYLQLASEIPDFVGKVYIIIKQYISKTTPFICSSYLCPSTFCIDQPSFDTTDSPNQLCFYCWIFESIEPKHFTPKQYKTLRFDSYLSDIYLTSSRQRSTQTIPTLSFDLQRLERISLSHKYLLVNKFNPHPRTFQ